MTRSPLHSPSEGVRAVNFGHPTKEKVETPHLTWNVTNQSLGHGVFWKGFLSVSTVLPVDRFEHCLTCVLCRREFYQHPITSTLRNVAGQPVVSCLPKA